MRGASVFSRLRSSLSFRTAVALAVGLVAALAFIEVTEELLEGEAAPFDRRVSLWLHRLDAPALLVVMRAFTWLGSVPFMFGVVALVAAWALRRRRRALAGVFVAVASAAEGLNLLLKVIFRRPRPDLATVIATPESYSFPSGHAMVSIAVYGMVALVAARLRPRLRVPLYIGTPILVLLIGASRVFLGVHWASDVLAGFAAGGLVLVMGKLALDGIHRAGEHERS